MEKYRVGFVLMFLTQFCHGALEIQETQEDMDMHKCVAMIMQRIELVNATDVTLINVNVSLVKELHSLMDHPVRFISRSFYWPNDTVYNDVYVIQFTDYLMFEVGLDLVRRDPFWNPRAKFIITIQQMEYLQDITDLLKYNHMYDVALVAYGEYGLVIMVYTFGLEHDECDRPVLNLLQPLSRCSEIHSFDRIFLAARKTTLRGCRVKFVSHNYWPFISFNNENIGVEHYLLNLINRYEHINVTLVDFGTVENFGSLLQNFTYTGMLHEIEIYNVEGAVGGYILTLNRMTNLDFIDPYMVDYYKIVVARAKLLNKWNGVLKQVGITTIWLIFGTFCTSCIIVIIMGVFKKTQRDICQEILIVWGYFLGNTSQIYSFKSGVPYRIVVLTILLYVFILSCATQASLLSSTTKPIRDYQPDTLGEVVSNSEYQLIVSPNQYLYLQSNSVVNLTNAKMSCKLTLDCMMVVMKNDNERLFTVASDIYHQSYLWKFADENGELKTHTIKEPLGLLLQTMYIRRGSSLVEPFNRMILRIRSAGLIFGYVKRINFMEQLKYKFHARKTKKPQTLKGLKGVFIVLLSGYCISSISFIFEYLRYR